MVTTVFYCPFLHVFYAAYVFYGTVFMYNHAILCIFSPNLEVEINVIIIIIHHQDVAKKTEDAISTRINAFGQHFQVTLMRY